MYTTDALAARNSLRTHPAVADGIHRFMRCYDFDPDGLLSFDEYARVNRVISQVLIPTLSSDEAKRVVREDWDEDRGGAPW